MKGAACVRKGFYRAGGYQRFGGEFDIVRQTEGHWTVFRAGYYLFSAKRSADVMASILTIQIAECRIVEAERVARIAAEVVQ